MKISNKFLNKLIEPSPFKVGVLLTGLFTYMVWSYYQVPGYRIRESQSWIRALNRLHELTIDMRFKVRGEMPPPQDQVALIVVDDVAVERLGRWPWPRTTIAQTVNELKKYGAKVVGFDSVFSEEDQNQALISLSKIQSSERLPAEMKSMVDAELDAANHDRHLAEAVKTHTDSLVMGSYFDEEEKTYDSHGHLVQLFKPYQDYCMDEALKGRPDYAILDSEKLPLLIEDNSPTEIPDVIIGQLNAVLGDIDEKVKQANLTKTPLELDKITRTEREQFCEHWLTPDDPYLDYYKSEWPKLREADKNLKELSFEDFLERMTSGRYLRNPVIQMRRLWPNVPAIAQNTSHTGYFNAFLSLDGTVRETHLVARYGSKLMPSLGLRSAQLYRGENLALVFENDPKYKDSKRIHSLAFVDGEGQPSQVIPVDSSGAIYINYAGPRYMFPHMSVAELLNGREDAKITQHVNGENREIKIKKADFIKDKIFVFGATAIGIFDLRVSPFDENYPGLETHANVISNIINSNFLRVHPDEPRQMVYGMMALGLVMSGLLASTGAVTGLLITCLSLFLVLMFDMALFRQGTVTTVMFPSLLIFGSYITLTFYKYLTEERKKAALKGTFQKYVSPQIVDQILKDPDNIQLGGKKQRMSVIFSDVRGFTTISEKLDPEKLGDVLNLYLSPMTRLVFKHKGTLDKYMGDAIMAFFGAPISYPEHAECACRCALDMMKELKQLHVEFDKQGLPHIDIGIGINTGDMSVGNMGSDIVRSYTVMGDAVNLGSRLEGINKAYGTHIIISEFTLSDIKDKFVTREIDWVRVKGKLLPVKIYELMAEGTPTPEMKQFVELFNQAVIYYHERKWDDALLLVERALVLQPNDGPSHLYKKRCQQFKEEPPADTWDGVYEMKEK